MDSGNRFRHGIRIPSGCVSGAVLDRSAERAGYLESGVTNLPAHEEDLRLW